MQCVQRIAQFEKMFQNSSDFLAFIEDTMADEQVDALSINSSCDDLDQSNSSGEEDLDKSFYSFNAFINLKSSKSRLEKVDIEDEKDFEILSVNAIEFINGFGNLSSAKNISVDGSFFSNKSLQKSRQSCSQMINIGKALTKRREGVKKGEKALRKNLEVEQCAEENKGLRKLRRVNTMKKVRDHWSKLLIVGFLKLGLFKLFIDHFLKLCIRTLNLLFRSSRGAGGG